jgi:hypothetical protein
VITKSYKRFNFLLCLLRSRSCSQIAMRHSFCSIAAATTNMHKLHSVAFCRVCEYPRAHSLD